MPPVSTPTVPDACLARVRALLHDGQRKLLGLVGPPGAGKSTFAEALRAAFGDLAQVVPMDGFHLANVELQRLGRSHRKGAPDTFDSAGYAALLQRLRTQGPDEVVYAPEFRREIEEPIAGAIAVPKTTPLVVTEGNYLLLQDEHWAPVRDLLDETWYVETDEELRVQRLIQRHIQFGKTPEYARAWVMRTDERNAKLVAATAHTADVLVRL